MLEMGCSSEISIRNKNPWKCITKTSSKIWRKVLGKNCAMYSVQRAFLREDNFRESKYSKLGTEENKQVETMKDCIGEETEISRLIASESTEKDDKLTINETVGKNSSCLKENTVLCSNNITDNPNTHYDSNSIDWMESERVLVEVQLETYKNSNDKQEICSDDKIIQNEITQEIIEIDQRRNEILSFTKNSEDDNNENDECSFSDQMKHKTLNECMDEDIQTNYNSENPKENVSIGNNGYDKEPRLKIYNEKTKCSPLNQIHESNNQCVNLITARIRVFQNNHSAFDDSKMTKNEKYNDPMKETDCYFVGPQTFERENSTEKMIDMVNLNEKQDIPSSIFEIALAKNHPQKIEKENNGIRKNGPNECEKIPTTISSASNPKRKNLSKEYSSVKLEVKHFSSLNQPKWSSNNQDQIHFKTHQEEEKPISLSVEVAMKNTVENEETHDMSEGSAKPTKNGIRKMSQFYERSEDFAASNKKSVSCEGAELGRRNETKQIEQDKDQDSDESCSENHHRTTSRENFTFGSLSDFLGLVETKVDSSFNTDPFSDRERHQNISSSSFYDLDGLTETRVDSSCYSGSMEIVNTTIFSETQSSNIDSEGYAPSRNDTDETGCDLDEITIEVTTLERSRTSRDVEGRIPSISIKKFETLFRKSSLKHLYKMMEKSHKKSRVRETPLDDLTQAKFVSNCYGPSMPRKEICMQKGLRH